MPLEKTSAKMVGSYKEIVDFVRNRGIHKMMGKAVSPEHIVKNMMHSDSGLITDLLPKAFGKKINGKWENQYSKVKAKLADYDIRAGKKIHDTLHNGKGKFRDKLSSSFVQKHDLPLSRNANGVADKNVELNVPMASAPLDKVKKVALPLVGGLTIASKFGPHSKEDKVKQAYKDGDSMEKLSSRDSLLDKISSIIDDNQGIVKDTVKASVDLEKLSSLVGTSSQMLKAAARDHRRLKSEVEKLAFENKRLHAEMSMKDSLEKAEKLAGLMNDKGVISKDDLSDQINKIMELDEAGYEMLKSAIENVNVQVKSGVDNLTFLTGDINIDIKDKKATLADSIGEN